MPNSLTALNTVVSPSLSSTTGFRASASRGESELCTMNGDVNCLDMGASYADMQDGITLDKLIENGTGLTYK